MDAGRIVVLQAVIATGLIVVGLTLFTFQTKYDFTSWMGVLWMVLLAFGVFGLVRLFFPSSRLIDSIYSGGMAIIVSIYLVIDIQLIIGQGKVSIETDEYIMAALMLYTDIVALFLYLLQFLAAQQRDE
eukprot:Trichotokara_eunicae@DN4996_c0_g1_i4.p1